MPIAAALRLSFEGLPVLFANIGAQVVVTPFRGDTLSGDDGVSLWNLANIARE